MARVYGGKLKEEYVRRKCNVQRMWSADEQYRVVLNFCGLDMFSDFAVFSTIHRKTEVPANGYCCKHFLRQNLLPWRNFTYEHQNSNGYEPYHIKIWFQSTATSRKSQKLIPSKKNQSFTTAKNKFLQNTEIRRFAKINFRKNLVPHKELLATRYGIFCNDCYPEEGRSYHPNYWKVYSHTV